MQTDIAAVGVTVAMESALAKVCQLGAVVQLFIDGQMNIWQHDIFSENQWNTPKAAKIC